MHWKYLIEVNEISCKDIQTSFDPISLVHSSFQLLVLPVHFHLYELFSGKRKHYQQVTVDVLTTITFPGIILSY